MSRKKVAQQTEVVRRRKRAGAPQSRWAEHRLEVLRDGTRSYQHVARGGAHVVGRLFLMTGPRTEGGGRKPGARRQSGPHAIELAERGGHARQAR